MLTMHLSLPEARYKEAVEQVAFFERLIAGVPARCPECRRQGW